jgi:hypothetical protein
MNQRETLTLEAQIVEQLRTCFDPEIPVNIYDLGLIYAITVTPSGAVQGGRQSWGDGCAGQCGLGPALGPQHDV